MLPTSATPACAAPDVDPEWWVRDGQRITADNRHAARLCSTCPVLAACAADYRADPDPHTVNGATWQLCGADWDGRRCRRCQRPVIPSREWAQLSDAHRDAARARGVTRTCRRGLCDACIWASTRDGTLSTYPLTRSELPQVQLVELWQRAHRPGQPAKATARSIAAHLGKSTGSVYQAAHRAGLLKRGGDDAA
jgi:hypothetical protein